jgi:hypothetical protein
MWPTDILGSQHTQKCNTYIIKGNEEKVNSYTQTYLHIGKKDAEQTHAYGYKNSYHIL